MSASSKCPHLEFKAQVNVQRMEDTGLKYAELTVECLHCGAPAVWRGLPMGLSPDQPTSSIDAKEAVLPFLCEGDVYTPIPGQPTGFSVKKVR